MRLLLIVVEYQRSSSPRVQVGQVGDVKSRVRASRGPAAVHSLHARAARATMLHLYPCLTRCCAFAGCGTSTIIWRARTELGSGRRACRTTFDQRPTASPICRCTVRPSNSLPARAPRPAALTTHSLPFSVCAPLRQASPTFLTGMSRRDISDSAHDIS